MSETIHHLIEQYGLIAVFLGWAILSEEITAYVVAGTSVIVASVAFVVRSPAEKAPAA